MYLREKPAASRLHEARLAYAPHIVTGPSQSTNPDSSKAVQITNEKTEGTADLRGVIPRGQQCLRPAAR